MKYNIVEVIKLKVGITLDDKLLARIDEYSDENYMSRSGLISLACTQYLNSAEVTKAITEMALCMRKIADNGTVDHDIMEQLEDFERLSKMLVGK